MEKQQEKLQKLSMQIPFNRPFIGKEEIEEVLKKLKLCEIGGDGPEGKKVEKMIRKIFKTDFVLLTTSCTHALELSLMVSEIGKGDEVILPSFAFVSAANAIVLQGAKPVFCEIEDEYFNIDPNKIEGLVNPRTKAIILIHYAGWSCQMEKILKIGRKYNLKIIEDAAQAVGSKYKGRYLGTIGDIGCYSFHETKNLTCGEGGAFLTNDKKLAKKAEIMREKGTNRSAFLRGEVDKYTWVDKGSSYVLSDILASIIGAQLKKMEKIISKRKKIGIKYLEGLKELEKKGKIILPSFDEKKDFNWHIFYFRVHSEKERNFLLKRLKEKGIGATFHFIPLHSSPYAKKYCQDKKYNLPITEKVSKTLVRLPIYPDLTIKEQDYIISTIWKILR